ncbi:MAG: pseudouridine synthase [Thermodesulfobacteriota bacterium]
MAAAGITSRRKAEILIQEGRVTINGLAAKTGARVDPYTDTIEVDGRLVPPPSIRKTCYLLNKPKGVISSLHDPEGRLLVTDFIGAKKRVFPVGRLDFDAEGVLLLTDDGDLANRLIHPRYSVAKKYLVKVRNVPEEKTLERLRSGVHIEGGRTRPARVKFIRKTEANAWLEITVREGRNRLIKNMCMAVGHPVTKLKRLEFAGLGLGGLAPGAYRKLTEHEVERLKKLGGEGKRV